MAARLMSAQAQVGSIPEPVPPADRNKPRKYMHIYIISERQKPKIKAAIKTTGNTARKLAKNRWQYSAHPVGCGHRKIANFSHSVF